jgi:hypothetical protein
MDDRQVESWIYYRVFIAGEMGIAPATVRILCESGRMVVRAALAGASYDMDELCPFGAFEDCVRGETYAAVLQRQRAAIEDLVAGG